MQSINELFPKKWLSFLEADPIISEKLLNAWRGLNEVQQKYPGKKICPKETDIFNALERVPPREVRIVLLGQDPYHGKGQAHGLSFSVPKTKSIPPSLRNVFKELNNSIPAFVTQDHGDLSEWADQGVLLLNAILTVFESEPASHRNIGWQDFTDRLIAQLSERKKGLVFLLWGNFAKKKAALIDETKHLILQAAHPSPLARGAFFGSDHFNKANEYLINHGRRPIKW